MSAPCRRVLRLLLLGMCLAFGWPGAAASQTLPAASVWMRLDPLPAEMALTPRESFKGVPPRFVLLTDGSVFVGGRRELLGGRLNPAEMQALSTALDAALKSLGKEGPPPTVPIGEGPATFRLSVLLGSPLQTVATGFLPEESVPPLSPLADFIRSLARFRHPSLQPFDPAEFAMSVSERTLPGGCRPAEGLPSLSGAVDTEVVVSERVARGFPTGAEMAQVCEGGKRFVVVFRPLVPGER